MNAPKVSVIIPVYNVEAHIARCAKSLFEQTLDEIEYIFVNDCTPDESMQVLRRTMDEYPHRCPQVKIINLPVNQGAAKAREIGIKAAKGEYIIQCDSDDWVDRDMSRILYEEAKQGDYDMVICDWYDSDGQSNQHINQKIKMNKNQMMADLIGRRLSSSLCNKLIKRTLFTHNRIIPPKTHMMEDVAYAIQLTYYSSKVSYLPIPLYYYYNNPRSICREPSEASCLNRCRQAIDNINIVVSFLSDKGLSDTYSNEIVMLKNSARVFLWPILLQHFKKNYKAWTNVYPEINWKYPFNRAIDINLRVIFFLTLIGIYPLIHKIIKR